jgi:DNA topoisomerase-1
MKDLIIVESPTKAKTLTKFLGKDYKVASSMGHIRDLPKSKMGVDIANNFIPTYVIPTAKKKTVAELKKLAEKADTIYFASDEDREGEAIAWHLLAALKIPAEKTKRIAFHEITKDAVLEALNNPREINQNLVDAQQARRILDRLVGYELSPLLWKKIARGLSAGRVQSVAVRLIVEREREREAFKVDEYWTIEAKFAKAPPTERDEEVAFDAKLHKVDGNRLEKLAIKNEKEAKEILKVLENTNYKIVNITRKESKKNPPAPYTTSTLQQDANRKLGFSAKQTMMFAQQLYEGVDLGSEGSVGLITYMRTDSLNLSDKFLGEAKNFITDNFGEKYYEFKKFKTKSKGAQEAHEAIRPTSAFNEPEKIKDFLEPRQYKLYKLIWQRALASQMSPALVENTSVDIETTPPPPPIRGAMRRFPPDRGGKGGSYTFRATGSVIKFEGYLKVYPNIERDKILPKLEKDETVDLKEIKPIQHFTEPPARYSDATLVKALEEYGIGRPSTYAPTINTIQVRNYVERDENKKFKPTEIGILVNDLLVEHFSKIVDYEFTARVEEEFDEIAEDKLKWQPMIKKFYDPFHKNIQEKMQTLDKKKLTEEKTDEKCEKCGNSMVIKMGRFGKFLACSNYPDCKTTKNIASNGEIEEPEETGEVCENCGSKMVFKRGRYGKFMACSKYPECKTTKQVQKSTGVKCPKCQQGDIVEKRSKRGRNFYACDQYPDCKNAYWSKPTGQICPDCDSLIVFATKGKVKCSNKECGFSKDAEDK